MPRPNQAETILAAALSCFAERGYDGTRIRQIAEAANVSEGALYRHYPSKEAVAQALYARSFHQFSLALQAALGSEQPVELQLRAALAAILATYRAHPDAFTFVLLRQPGFMPTLPPETIYPVELIEQLIVAGQGAGVIRDGQPNLLAAIVLGCVLRPIIVSQLAQPGALDLLTSHAHDQVIADACWAALARPKSELP